MKSYDLLVIGGGSGGVRTARLAAQKGLSTAIVEGRHWGGTCVNLGCIPKKYMVFAADQQANFQLAADYGWQCGGMAFHWDRLRDHLRNETQRLQEVYRQMLVQAGVELVDGYARFTSPTEVQVGEEIYKAQKIVLATGSRPFMADIPGQEYALSSDDIFSLPNLPPRVVIYGGGYIAMEFASIFAGLGVEVSLIHRSSRVLRQLDDELANFAMREMAGRIRFIFNNRIQSLDKTAEGVYQVRLRSNQQQVEDAPRTVTADAVVFAMGRIPQVSSLDLETAGVKLTEGGAVAVDDDYRTSRAHIFALGDLIARRALTPVAIAEATALVNSDFGRNSGYGLNYAAIPTAIFCRPELATVGLTEARMREKDAAGEVYTHSFIPMKWMFSERKNRFFIKLLCAKNQGRLLGIHIAGEEASEIIQGFATALAAGLRKRDLDKTIGIHPTIGEELLTLR